MSKDKKFLVVINTIMKVFFIFFEIFFGIYVYNVSQNINLIIGYNIFKLLSLVAIIFIIYSFVKRKTLLILYRLSFVLAILSILSTLFISQDKLFMIFVSQFFLALTEMFYYLPYEVALMKKNSRAEMGGFLATISALSLFVSTLSPFLSGLIIDLVSYIVLFSILIVLTVLSFIFSTQVNFQTEEINKIGIFNYFKLTRKYKNFKHTFISYSLYKMANDLVVSIFLPIIIYLKTGTNFSVGLYSSLASLIAGIFVLLFGRFSKNKTLTMWLNTILQVCVSILILISSSLVIFFIYFFVKKITRAILQNGVNSSMFSLIQNTSLENNPVEHFCAYNIVDATGVLIVFIACLIVYTFINNIVAITVMLAVISLLQVVSTLFLNIGDKMVSQNSQ